MEILDEGHGRIGPLDPPVPNKSQESKIFVAWRKDYVKNGSCHMITV